VHIIRVFSTLRSGASAVFIACYAGPGLADSCEAILKDGVMEVTQHDKGVTESNLVRKHVCTESDNEQSMDDDKAFALGSLIRIMGFKIGLKKSDVLKWRTSNCSSDDQFTAKSTTDNFYTKRASATITNAWLRCHHLEWRPDGWGVSAPVSVTDSRGSAVEMQIAVLGRQFYWDIARTDRVLFSGKPINIVEKFRSLFWKDAFAHAKDIFAVGTASCGLGKSKSERVEIDRAARRASQLLEWMTDSNSVGFQRDRSLGTINLGRYSGEYCAEGTRLSELQRPIIIVLVLSRADISKKPDLRAALADAATNHPAFPNLKDYSNFDMTMR
jgi:hypothetical protein